MTTFSVSAQGGQSVSEDELAGAFDLTTLGDPWRMDGTIEITVDTAAFEISDTLVVAIQNLCFDGIATILEDPERPFIYQVFSADSLVVMIAMQDLVRVFAQDDGSVTDHASRLLPDLYRCGLRYVGFLERLGASGTGVVDYLRPFADRARGQLERHALI